MSPTTATISTAEARRRAVGPENPWPGPEAFGTEDADFFRGREDESELLTRLVLSHRVTLLFGRSGLGKTSLLQAGLFPRLEAHQILPIYIRLIFAEDGGDPLAQLQQAIRAGAPAGYEVPQPRPGQSLWEYLHRKEADFWSDRNKLLMPVLVFDQFEEIFGSRATDSRDALLEELEQVVWGRAPENLVAEVESSAERLSEFDFTRHHYRLLFSIREDFLAQFEAQRRHLPIPIDQRMRLLPMNGDAAFRVAAQAPDIMSAQTARKVVRFVAAEEQDSELPLDKLEVDPGLLSIFCWELNRKRGPGGMIGDDLLAGAREEILEDFYQRCVADQPREVRAFIENELLTEADERDSEALANVYALHGISDDTIRSLVDKRLLRIDRSSGVDRIELTHDRLIDPVRKSRNLARLEIEQREIRERARAAREEAEQARQDLKRSRRRALIYLVLTLGFLVVAVVALLTAGWAVRERKVAREARYDAELNLAEANRAREAEKTALGKAQVARKAAEEKAELARREAKRAREAETLASENLEVAKREKERAVRAKQAADDARQAADDARQDADDARQAADDARQAADVAKQVALDEKREAQRLWRLSVGRQLATKSLELRGEEQRELAALLALEGYRLHQANRRSEQAGKPDEPEPPEIYTALRRALDRLLAREGLRFPSSVLAMAFSPDGRSFFAGTENGRVYWYDWPDGSPPLGLDDQPRVQARKGGEVEPRQGRRCAQLEAGVRALVVSRDGAYLAAGTEAGGVRIWDLEAAPVKPKRLDPVICSTGVGQPAERAFGPPWTDLYLGLEAGQTARVKDLVLAGDADAPAGVRLFAALKIRRPGESSSELRWWRLPAGAEQPGETLRADLGEIQKLAWRPDGKPDLAVAAAAGTYLISSESRDPVVPAHEAHSTAVVFRQGEPQPLSAARSGAITLGASMEGAPRKIDGAHAARVTALALSPVEPSRLASASFDGTVKLWRIEQSEALPVSIADHDGWVWDVAFRPGTDRLVTAAADRKLRAWTTRSEPLERLVTESLSRTLTRPECEELVPEDLWCQTACAGYGKCAGPAGPASGGR